MAETFRINVVIDPSRAKTGAQEAGRQIDKVSKKADGLGKNLRRAFGLIGGALLLRSSIGILASFSQEMSTVGAVSNATADELARLEERALSLGKTTRFTATQAAAGLTELARAGLQVDQSIEAIGTSLTLAQAGGVSIADAAAVTTTALKVFNIEAANSARVADVLVIAANSAKTNVGELGQAFTFVAANANDLDVSLEDTAAALGVLAEGGLAGTRGGTALRSVLLGLAAPSREAEAAILAAGLSMEDVDIKVRGLVPVLQTLSDAQLDSGAKAAIFGKRFSAASSILFDKLGKFDEISGKFKTLGGEALRVSEAMDDNLNGALLRAKSAFQGLVLTIGQSGGLDVLTNSANGLAVAFNFLGDNVEALGVSMAILAVGFALTKVGFLTTTTASLGATIAYIANNGAASALAVAHTGLGVAALNAAAALKTAAIAAAANPFTVLAVGAIAAFVAIKELTQGIEEYEAALKTSEAGKFGNLTEFAKANEHVRDINDSIAVYQERLDSGNISQKQFEQVTGTLATKLAFYQSEVARLDGSQEKAAASARELAVATSELNVAFDLSKAGLAEEARLLGFANQEREIQAGLLEKIKEIQEAGGPELLPEQLAELELILRKNQGLSDQAEALDGIRGPQEEFIRQLTALQGLLDDETISTQEFNKAVADLATSADGVDLANLELPEGIGADIDFEAQIAGLRELIAAEQERLQGEQLRASLIDEIIGTEARLVESQAILKQLFDENVISGEQYREKLAEINAELNPLDEGAKSLASTLESIKGPQEEANQRFTDLGILLREEKITIDEYNAAVAKMGPNFTSAAESTTVMGETLSGLEAGLEAGLKGLTDVSGAAESLATNAFANAEDALVSFVTTGEADFKKFTESLLSDIARLLLKQALLAAFGGGGGTGGAIGSLFGGGKAEGGPVNSDQAFLVGEEGPELFVPPGAGNIKTAAETAGVAAPAAPAPVNVTVLNTSDPADTISAMGSAQGTQLIMNAISQNPTAIKNALQ